MILSPTFSVSKPLIISGALLCFLTGCSSDLEDEKFQLLPGSFPNLIDVPDRPVVPQNSAEKNYFGNLQEKLLEEREKAYQDKQENLKQRKETSK